MTDLDDLSDIAEQHDLHGNVGTKRNFGKKRARWSRPVTMPSRLRQMIAATSSYRRPRKPTLAKSVPR